MIAPARIGAVSAWPHPGVTAVELWDMMIDGATLFAQREAASFPRSLGKAVLALRRGEAVRAGGEVLPALAWDAVALVGGAVDESRTRDAFDAAGIPLDVVSADPLFAASHGREALVESRRGNAGAVVIDAGQTAIKACGPAGRVHRARTTPMANDGAQPAPEDDPHRAAFVAEISSVLLEACGETEPSYLLLGVPCEVTTKDHSLVLGVSTHPIAGDGASLVRAITRRAGCEWISSAIVNDAVLAAWALASRSPSPARSRLVLTLGHGVGAALVERTCGVA